MITKAETGKYIVLEGLPKCGKSTQAGLLYKGLTTRFVDREIVLTKDWRQKDFKLPMLQKAEMVRK